MPAMTAGGERAYLVAAAEGSGNQMNPFYWTHQHRMAWLIISLTGAIAGLLFDYIQSPFFFAPGGWQVFETWLQRPGIYWVWALSGFFVTALLFYLAQLGRASN